MPSKVRTTRSRTAGAPDEQRAARRKRDRAQQRVAIALAMVDAVAVKGYRETTVADVIERAQLSRKTFYEHFSNKEDCFLQTYDEISSRAVRRMELAHQEARGWQDRVEAPIGALFDAAIENPGAARLMLLEINALGPAGIRRRTRSADHYERFIRDALELAPGSGSVSEPVVKAVAGGLQRVLCRRIMRGERGELLALIPDLAKWAMSYYPTPSRVLAEKLGSGPTPPVAAGGRAPGTLAPHPTLTNRRGLPGGDQNVSRSFVVHSQRERILDAATNLTATNGYIELKVEDIAECEAIFTTLMGEDVEARRKFIEENALDVKNLDI